MTNITENELFAALENYLKQESAPNDGTFTRRELQEITGITYKKAQDVIRQAVEDGVIENTPSMRKNVAGIKRVELYAYRLVEKGEPENAN